MKDLLNDMRDKDIVLGAVEETFGKKALQFVNRVYEDHGLEVAVGVINAVNMHIVVSKLGETADEDPEGPSAVQTALAGFYVEQIRLLGHAGLWDDTPEDYVKLVGRALRAFFPERMLQSKGVMH